MKKPAIDQDIIALCKELGAKSPIDLVGRKIYFSYTSPVDGVGIVNFFSSIITVSISECGGKNMQINVFEINHVRFFRYSFDEKKWEIYKRKRGETQHFSFFCCLKEIYIYKKK